MSLTIALNISFANKGEGVQKLEKAATSATSHHLSQALIIRKGLQSTSTHWETGGKNEQIIC